ncbi:hypothetical protein GPECTOR_1958g999 [Gonium pectorale]|uniref:Uncharacterized protein n=1 Tax=Gonium pectorale TaxID=33097 RepID=A0A150FT94_GONPE|nr:hypothetical protein GPECTOR_1958g999 [Gonium pectorale]|eukprot:KXZ40841.1 hypothetical protein GPECTOR_1958g999 [Gonium pectorale]
MASQLESLRAKTAFEHPTADQLEAQLTARLQCAEAALAMARGSQSQPRCTPKATTTFPSASASSAASCFSAASSPTGSRISSFSFSASPFSPSSLGSPSSRSSSCSASPAASAACSSSGCSSTSDGSSLTGPSLAPFPDSEMEVECGWRQQTEIDLRPPSAAAVCWSWPSSPAAEDAATTPRLMVWAPKEQSASVRRVHPWTASSCR